MLCLPRCMTSRAMRRSASHLRRWRLFPYPRCRFKDEMTMQIKEKVLLHNKFDVKVVDSRTGEVKQTATAYNVITNYYFNSRLLNSPMYKTSDLLTYIAVGTGAGTPAITDTALFTHLTRKEGTTIEP